MTVEITQSIAGYELVWGDDDVYIKASRVQVHASDNRVTGELLICNNGDRLPIYPATSFNFTAERTRTQLVKTLSDNDERNWKDIINQTCVAVVKRAREGRPVEELWTSENVTPPEYLLEPILTKGLPTIIFGDKGVTKSKVALLVYICLTLPWDDNPFGWRTPDRVINSLIIDYELPGQIAQWNARQIQQGMGLPHFALQHHHAHLPLADDIEQVSRRIEEVGAEVLIIDSLARACGGDLIKTEAPNAFFEALDKLNVTSLIIAQTSKDIETKRKTIYGNALFTYYARSIFELCRSEDNTNDSELSVALFHRWANLSRLYPDLGIRWNFNGRGTTVDREALSWGDFKTKIKGTPALMAALRDGAKTAAQLADVLEWKEASVRPLLTKLKKKGDIVDLGSGLWGLAYTRNVIGAN